MALVGQEKPVPANSLDDDCLLAHSLACGADTVLLRRCLAHPASVPDDVRTRVQRHLDSGDVRRWLAQLRRQGWSMLSSAHANWPSLLDTLPDAPGLLFVRGDSDCLSQPQLAMVGARHASPEGCARAEAFARDLASQGFVITSGLAFGIDAAAHKGAMAGGRTVAVLAHGPEQLYPARHRALADALVAAGGALVTEFPPGTAPLKRLFPHRNRIIAGMSLATLVIEAAERSGSLVTARLAGELGREVFAMPGALHNPFSRGCHKLLREGANWLESLADLAEALPQLALMADAVAPSEAPPDHPLLRHFVAGINGMEALQQRSGLDAVSLAQQLAELELAGLVQRHAGGYCRCH